MADQSGRGNEEFSINFDAQQLPEQFGNYAKWGAVIVGIIVLFAALSFLRTVYTDWIWFENLGFKGVFVKVLVTRIVLFFIGAAIFSALISVSVFMAFRLSRGPVTLPIPPEALVFVQRVIIVVSILASVVLSVIFGALLASRWELFLRFANSVSFGLTDPVFNRDVSFYVFTLPTLDFIQGWLLGAVIITLLATAGLYFVRFNMRGPGIGLTAGLKIHLSVIASLIMFAIAWGHWLDRWGLLLSGEGAIFGAAYADVNARMPALLVLAIIAVGSGILMLVNAYLRGIRLLAGAAGLWVVMAILLGNVWPSLMQQFTVNPNEFVREQPFIARNIEFTRAGFALDRISEQFYPAETKITADIIKRNLQTVNNTRLWDYRPLTSVYRQIQLIRPYYEFHDADVDRYIIDGELRQVLLSAREVAPEKLQPETQTWTNTRLVYTHGIGIAMSPVTEFTTEGLPEFFAKDIPAEGIIPIQSENSTGDPEIIIDNPRIYYGENTLEYIVVNSQTDELDYQTGTGELFRTNYTGRGGVRLSSFIQRIAYAWQFGDINIFISGQITGDSRIQYRRQIQERISVVAPFLLLDQDPYVSISNGQLFWVQDAYTFTDKFPYSDPIDGSLNYMRNSVKVTVDAFNGDLRFYIWDDTDPIVKTYANIFPDLFLSQSDMPQELKEHVRYPQDFFRIQAEKYIKYHMQEPENFYNNEDLWAVAEEKFGQDDALQLVEPYYVIMKLPEEDKEEFVLLLPYTPNERQNLIGWLAARSDGEHYGKLIAFNFPKDRQVDGPAQVEARIDNDQDISAWFTLRCSEGSDCIRGNLLVIPVEESILYAEPIYIQAEGVSFPQLKRVILATGEKVVMEDSLDEALASLTGVSITSRPRPVNGEAPPPESSVPTNLLESQIETLKEAVQGLKDNLSQLEDALDSLTDSLGNN